MPAGLLKRVQRQLEEFAMRYPWLKVGVAFPHKDGNGFDIKLDAVPVTGRVVLRANDPRDKATA
jgi:hypothetical protein